MSVISFVKRKFKNRFNLKEKNKFNRPRLCVFKSGRHIYASIIDDLQMKTLCSSSSLNKDIGAAVKTWSIDCAKLVGKSIGSLAIKSGIKDVVFDRGGYPYHGKIKALADAAREAGLNF